MTTNSSEYFENNIISGTFNLEFLSYSLSQYFVLNRKHVS